MTPNGTATFLKVVLALGGIVGLVYGIQFLFVPGTLESPPHWPLTRQTFAKLNYCLW